MYGPTIPATGGGWFILPTAGLVLGTVISNGIIIAISIALIVLIILNMIRLRRGEQKIIARDNR